MRMYIRWIWPYWVSSKRRDWGWVNYAGDVSIWREMRRDNQFKAMVENNRRKMWARLQGHFRLVSPLCYISFATIYYLSKSDVLIKQIRFGLFYFSRSPVHKIRACFMDLCICGDPITQINAYLSFPLECMRLLLYQLTQLICAVLIL